MLYGRKDVNDYKIIFNDNIHFIINTVIEEKITISGNKGIKGSFYCAMNDSDFIKKLANSFPIELDIITTARSAETGKDNNIVYAVPCPVITYTEEMNTEGNPSIIKIEFNGRALK